MQGNTDKSFTVWHPQVGLEHDIGNPILRQFVSLNKKKKEQGSSVGDERQYTKKGNAPPTSFFSFANFRGSFLVSREQRRIDDGTATTTTPASSTNAAAVNVDGSGSDSDGGEHEEEPSLLSQQQPSESSQQQQQSTGGGSNDRGGEAGSGSGSESGSGSGSDSGGEEEGGEEQAAAADQGEEGQRLARVPVPHHSAPRVSSADPPSAAAAAAPSAAPVATMSRQPSGGGLAYRVGAIVRIRMVNFVTYDDCEMHPGPGLNVVIGPNGSGKSSIVCALALGLGGAPNWAQSNEGKPATHKDVKAKCDELHIQVDNPCQFLPQDKVCTFAALNAFDRLKRTEAAVGKDNMVENHEKLIHKKEEEKALSLKTDECEKRVKELAELNDQLEQAMLKYKERQRFLEEVKILGNKKLWILFENQRQVAFDLKLKLDEDKKKFLEAQKSLEEAKVTQSKRETQAHDIDIQLAEKEKDLKFCDSKLRTLHENIKKSVTDIDKYLREISILEKRAADRQKTIQEITEKMKRAEEDIKQQESPEQIQSEMKQIQAELQIVVTKLATIRSDEYTYSEQYKSINLKIQAVQKQITDLEDAKKQKLRFLERQDRDAYAAYMWLQQNQSMFSSPICGPLFLECTVTQPKAQDYLEMTTPAWLLKSFVAETIEDRNRFLKAVTDEQKLQVNVVNVDRGRPLSRPADLSQLAKFDVQYFLGDAVKAPPSAIAALNSFASVHLVAIGTENTLRFMDALPSGIMFYTPSSQLLKTQSRWNPANISTRILPVKQAQWLGRAVDEDQNKRLVTELQSLQRELNQQANLIKSVQELAQAETKRQAVLTNSRNELKVKVSKTTNLKEKLEQLRFQLEATSKEENTAGECETLQRRITSSRKAKHEGILQLPNVFTNLVQALTSKNVLLLQQHSVSVEIQILRQNLRKLQTEYDSSTKLIATATHEVGEAKKLARTLYNNANTAVPLTPEVRTIFSKFPGTIDEIESAIARANAKADLNTNADPTVVSNYEAQKKEIAQQRAKLEKDKEELERCRNDLGGTLENWLGSVRTLVEDLNNSFKRYMAAIGCQGEVSLLTHESDFEKYGIEISVKFREEVPLAPLTAQTQSGGERSVATMLYLLSLQTLTSCPFRLVDEINQGMDPYNERNIFMQISQTASKPGLPQYFLITPKLLPDLQFTKDMRILCVYNGPWLSNTKF
ncbi:structural maintenance of chromosome protein [Pelomyxa schiedti]|nr:structural maintenance of chromosome protein [Pelomyxa schiedti]